MVADSDSQAAISYSTNGMKTAPPESIEDYDGPPVPVADSTGYKIREQPYGTRRHVRVVLMGAGASSLNFFKKSEDEMQNVDIVCYEKNNDIGGTWLENRYPGDYMQAPAAIAWLPNLAVLTNATPRLCL
jgi:hypothetical protein